MLKLKKEIATYLFICVLLYSLPANAYNALEPKKPTISFAGSEKCPYNCYGKNDKALLNENSNFVDQFHPNDIVEGHEYGYVVDIIKTIFEAKEHKVVYKVVPQDRAIRKVAKGVYTMFLTDDIDSDKAKENFLFSAKPVGLNKKKFFTNVISNWRYDGIKSLQKITLGVINGENYPELGNYVEENLHSSTRIESAYSDDGIDINMRKLAKQRIDAIFENEYVINYHRKIMGLEDIIVDSDEVSNNNENHKFYYLGFSRKQEHATEYLKQFDEGIEELRNSGELSKILDKYGIEDWQEK